MDFKPSWDVAGIIIQLHRMRAECSSKYIDGFNAFEIKKDLLQVKFLLDDILESCPKFVGEEELYHKHLLNRLKK